MEKRGQFYLMAAIIIVVVLVGVATVTNIAITRQSADEIKIYQLSQELELEGEQVVNFGIFNNRDVDDVLADFTEEYGEYISNQESDIYFIYGDKKGLNVIGYVAANLGNIGLDFGGQRIDLSVEGSAISLQEYDFFKEDGETINIRSLEDLFGCVGSACNEYVENGKLIKTDVIVEVGGTKYPFEIKEGQNFFFVLQQGGGEELDEEA
jgi:hypothetical protein